MRKLSALLLVSLLPLISLAQESESMIAAEMRSSGKIYVVVAVIAVVFIGIAAYLFSIDNRLKKIEKNK